jgi:transcriptional regulator GlxA family with amidase domain
MKLVAISGFSPSTLNRAFRRAVGLPPSAYHLRLRIRKAADMLRTTDMSVTEIAGRTGFDDANYFARVFRKTMGISPVFIAKEGNRTKKDVIIPSSGSILNTMVKSRLQFAFWC